MRRVRVKGSRNYLEWRVHIHRDWMHQSSAEKSGGNGNERVSANQRDIKKPTKTGSVCCVSVCIFLVAMYEIFLMQL